MKTIPTAEEFLKNKFKQIYAKRPKGLISKISESRYLDLYVTGRIDGREQNYPEMMIEFAKLHVESALKEASKNAECYLAGRPGDYQSYVVKSESILKAYPLKNIK